MQFSEIAQQHLRYHRWATNLVLDESAPLDASQQMQDFKGSFRSIYETLVHLYQTDTIWLERLEGRPSGTAADYEAPGCTWELKEAWLAVQDRMIAWAEALSEEDWARDRSYKTMAGAPQISPAWQIVLHIVNHGSYHRGQVTNMIRALGLKPVNLDLIAYYRANVPVAV